MKPRTLPNQNGKSSVNSAPKEGASRTNIVHPHLDYRADDPQQRNKGLPYVQTFRHVTLNGSDCALERCKAE
jgi:hypothetical protein